jgi:nucleoid-associated protein YgaU
MKNTLKLDMDIKKFEEFELGHTSVNEDKTDKNQNLADDVEVYSKNEEGEIEKLDSKEWEVSKIVDVIKDPKEIEDIEKQLSEKNVGFKLSTDLDAKDLKRGDTIYLTAILAPRNKSVAYSPGTMGVIKARIVDMYYGLSKLKNIMRNQR